jgi:hypothetical protein
VTYIGVHRIKWWITPSSYALIHKNPHQSLLMAVIQMVTAPPVRPDRVFQSYHYQAYDSPADAHDEDWFDHDFQ